MKLESLTFENYKAFPSKQEVRLRPITLLLGKNSSGKSSVAKLFTLLENSLSGVIKEPLLTNNNGVELGAEFRDLVFGRNSAPVSFEVRLANGRKLSAKVIQDRLNYALDILEWSIDDYTINYSPDSGFVDQQGKVINIGFNGFIPLIVDGLEATDGFTDFSDFHVDVDYIGPFRVLPQRQFYLTGQIDYAKTGIKGENAYAMLAVSKVTGTPLLDRVGIWFAEHFDGWKLVVESTESSGNSSFFQVLLQRSQTRIETTRVDFLDDISVNIVDVGQGMNQALPLVVRAFTGRPDSIVVLEQPELHLHPAAHGDLAELFARSAKEYGQCFVLETHAENMLLRLRKLVVENDFGFTPADLVIYWSDDAENGGQELEEIIVGEDGSLSNWKDGVFNENLEEILDIQKAVRRKQSDTK